MIGPFQVVRDFEAAVCEYTGARYCVTTNSCTMALLLAVRYVLSMQDDPFSSFTDDGPTYDNRVSIPKRTYVSVPMSIIHAGGRPVFRNEDWRGSYALNPLNVIDSARWFTSGFYVPHEYRCCSFHISKTLGDSQGGCILHDNDEADAWFRRMRFDGRTEGVPPNQDNFREIGYHCYMSVDTAARLLWRLQRLPKHNEPLPNDDYPELDKMEIFK